MPLTKEPLVRTAVLAGYPALAKSLGVNATAALRQAGIARSLLADPDCRIPVLQLNRLLEATAAAAHAEAVGLRLARDIGMEQLGMLRLLVQHATTAGDAFAIVGRYSQLHNEALSIWTERDGRYLNLRHEYLTRSPGGVREIVEMTAGVIVLNLRVIIGDDWRPMRACFRHDAPADLRVHRQVFRCPIQFAADFDGMVCPATDFARRNRFSGIDSNDLVRDVRAMATRQTGNSPLLRARKLIWALLPSGRCTTSEVARLLGMDRRTLHRHLVRHDESFSSLLDAVRVELAARHVRLGLRRIADVADLLGFRSQSDFSHWFRKHFGASPLRWQAQLRANDTQHGRGPTRPYARSTSKKRAT
jgi:AraC-like DNA-binding protein